MDNQMWEGCDVCGQDHDTESCPVLAMDDLACTPAQVMTRARVTLPHFLELAEQPDGSLRVVTKVKLPVRQKLGPFEARRTTQKISTDDGFVLVIMLKEGGSVCLDTTDENNCNWMCLVHTAASVADQNLMAVQLGVDIFYITTKVISPGTELRVWYAPHYARKVGCSVEPDGKTEVLLGRQLVSPPVLVFVDEGSKAQDLTSVQEGVSPKKKGADGTAKSQEQANNDYVMVLQDIIQQVQTKLDPKEGLEGTSGFDIPSQTATALNMLAAPRETRIKHKEKEDGPHTCKRCDAQFEDFQELAKHVKEHLKPLKKSGGRRGRRPGAEAVKKKRVNKQNAKKQEESEAEIESHPAVPATSTATGTTKLDEDATEDNTSEKTAIKIVDVTKNCSPAQDPEEEDGTKVISTVLNIKGSSPSGSQNLSQARRSARIQTRSSQAEVIGQNDSIDDETITAEFVAPEDNILPTTTETPVTNDILISLLEQPVKTNVTESIQASIAVTPPLKRRRVQAQISLPVRASRRDITKNCTITFDNNKHPIHKCNHCQKTFTKLEAFAKHLTSEHGSSVKCTMCSEMFVSNEAMESHDCSAQPQEQSSQSEEQSPADSKTCQETKVQTPIQALLEKPLKSAPQAETEEQQNEDTQDVEEKICLEVPEESHEQEPGSSKKEDKDSTEPVQESPPPLVQEEEEPSGEDQDQSEDIAETNLEETSDETLHRCDTCGKIFKTLKYLLRHVRGHTDAFHCGKCHKRFVRKESLQKHPCISKSAGKKEQGPFFCEFCGADFSQKKYLFRHMAAHTGEFKCKNCHREFSRKESLMQHMVKCCPEMVNKKGDGAHPCPLCNRVFTRELSLQNHMKLHTAAFKCDTCQRCFASQFSLEKHVCGAVSGKGGFACILCDKSFAKLIYLNRHMAIHTGNFCCVICNRQFSRKEELVKHTLECTAKVLVDSGEEIKCPVCKETFVDPPSFSVHYTKHTHPFTCDNCGRRFLRKSKLNVHKCNLTTGDIVECHICDKRFRNSKYLQRHMTVHNDPKYKCDQCKREFRRWDYYNNHTCRSESGEILPVPQIEKKSYLGRKSETKAICPTCGKTYVTISNLNKHMKTHGEKNETCEVCGKRFHLKVALREHMESVHTEENKHQCQFCGKFMKYKNSLFGHVRQFHSQTITLYACDQCGRKFRQKGNLKKHILTHSKKRTFKCEYCDDKSFKYPEQLRRHQLWHTEGQRFECEFCKRKFVMQFELRKHVKVFHSGIIYTCEFCFTECRHFHTMKRHLMRRHGDQFKWQADPTSYIKGLVRENPITDGERSQNIIEEEVAVDLHVPEQEEGTDSALPILENQPFIVAEVSGITEGGTEETTRTVIIQTTGQQFNSGVMSQEVAAALQSLSKQGALDDANTMTIIQNVGNGQAQILPLESGALQDEQGFIILPMGSTENPQETLNVLSAINTENPPS